MEEEEEEEEGEEEEEEEILGVWGTVQHVPQLTVQSL